MILGIQIFIYCVWHWIYSTWTRWITNDFILRIFPYWVWHWICSARTRGSTTAFILLRVNDTNVFELLLIERDLEFIRHESVHPLLLLYCFVTLFKPTPLNPLCFYIAYAIWIFWTFRGSIWSATVSCLFLEVSSQFIVVFVAQHCKLWKYNVLYSPTGILCIVFVTSERSEQSFS